MPADLHYLSLDEVAKRLMARKITSVEVTEAILDRIDKLDSRLKAFATITREQALGEGKRATGERISSAGDTSAAFGPGRPRKRRWVRSPVPGARGKCRRANGARRRLVPDHVAE